MAHDHDAKDIESIEQDHSARSKADLEKDFGLKEDLALDDDPILPHRKRKLFLACACILGG